MKVKILNTSGNSLPKYETEFSAGVDLKAWTPGLNPNDRIIIAPHSREVIGTGLFMAIPVGYELQIRPRSGLAAKQGISVLNSPGTVDADYRGEIKVIIMNHSDETVGFANGDRICQAVLKQVEQAEWDEVHSKDELPTTKRGEGGFGHTGVSHTPPDMH
jgi:dUTP pyrophosphatase